MEDTNVNEMTEAIDKLSTALVTLGVVMRDITESIEAVIDNIPDEFKEAIEDDG